MEGCHFYLNVKSNSWYTIIIAGGSDDWDYYDDILEYDPEEDTITSVGHMTQARAYHAISVVSAGDYLQQSIWFVVLKHKYELFS